MILGYYLDKYHIIQDVIDVIDGSNNGINYIVVLVVPYHISQISRIPSFVGWYINAMRLDRSPVTLIIHIDNGS